MSESRTRRILLLLALVVVAVLVAGCGDSGPSEEEYERGLGKVQRHLDDATDASRESGQTTDVEERRAKLGEAHEAIAAAARQAKELDPPDDARSAHDDFAEALADYADLFDQLARLEANDPKETELYTEAGEIAERLDAASRKLERAGYQVEPGDES